MVVHACNPSPPGAETGFLKPASQLVSLIYLVKLKRDPVSKTQVDRAQGQSPEAVIWLIYVLVHISTHIQTHKPMHRRACTHVKS